MPTSATTSATAAALASSLFRRSILPVDGRLMPSPGPYPIAAVRLAVTLAARGPRFSCQVALTADVSSSSSAEQEAEAEAKIGKRVRVNVPLKVYHVMKAPELDLNGLEGVVKQYVAVWKGKRVSANLPYKIEFQIEVAGQPRPVKFFAHLREDEFEFLPEE